MTDNIKYYFGPKLDVNETPNLKELTATNMHDLVDKVILDYPIKDASILITAAFIKTIYFRADKDGEFDVYCSDLNDKTSYLLSEIYQIKENIGIKQSVIDLFRWGKYNTWVYRYGNAISDTDGNSPGVSFQNIWKAS